MPGVSDGNRQVAGFYAPRIEIIAVPPGEAPEDIRRQWVGLIIPAAQDKPEQTETAGILTGPRAGFGWWLRRKLRQTEAILGYRVSARVALETLERKSPETAAWWRAQRPDFRDGKGQMFFPADVCRLVRAQPPAPANAP